MLPSLFTTDGVFAVYLVAVADCAWVVVQLPLLKQAVIADNINIRHTTVIPCFDCVLFTIEGHTVGKVVFWR